MADRVTLADGTALDMLDPLSIRAYVRRALAITVEPTQPQLNRLEMLVAMADELEAKQPTGDKPAGVLVLVETKDAAEVIRQRLANRGT
jgi:hypothetical protein